MFLNNFFTISDFAALMGVSRQTLIYYDRIGLFKPVKILDNKYRLYSRSQINVISMITMLSEMGVSLKEIKTIVARISPDTAIEVLKKQQNEIQKKIRKLKILEEMISQRIDQTTLGKEISEMPAPPFSFTEITEDVPLYLGKALNCSWKNISDDDIIDFFSNCEKLGLPLIFSGRQMKRHEDIIVGRTEIISNMYLPLRNSAKANSTMPKGKYAVGYVCGDCEKTDIFYKELMSFIEEKGMKIAGNAYEEYLLDELAESNSGKFVMKIMLRVE